MESFSKELFSDQNCESVLAYIEIENNKNNLFEMFDSLITIDLDRSN